jgi:hypothetical protein
VFPKDGRKEKIKNNVDGLFLPFSLLELVLEGGKKAAQCASGGNCTFQCPAFSEGNDVSHGILQAESICGTLRAQQFYFCRTKVGRQPGNFCLSSKRFVQVLYSSGPDVCWMRCLPAGAKDLGEGRTKLSQALAGHSLRDYVMLGIDILYIVS